MAKTLQIREVDDETYQGLARRAAEAGVSVPELVRRELVRIARRPTVSQWLERTRRRPSEIEPAEVIASLDDLRGDWPDARR